MNASLSYCKKHRIRLVLDWASWKHCSDDHHNIHEWAINFKVNERNCCTNGCQRLAITNDFFPFIDRYSEITRVVKVAAFFWHCCSFFVLLIFTHILTEKYRSILVSANTDCTPSGTAPGCEAHVGRCLWFPMWINEEIEKQSTRIGMTLHALT